MGEDVKVCTNITEKMRLPLPFIGRHKWPAGAESGRNVAGRRTSSADSKQTPQDVRKGQSM